MSDMFTDASPLSCSLEHLEEYYKKNENVVHIEARNGRNCSNCNKANVCKYQERVVSDVEKMIATLEKKELPLSVNINCREWNGNHSEMTYKENLKVKTMWTRAMEDYITEARAVMEDVNKEDVIRFFQCVNQLYNALFSEIKLYYIGLHPTHEKKDYCKIIETNLSMKDGQVYDHQSRVLEADNWNDYVEMFKEYDGFSVNRFRSITEMVGCSIPKDVEILNLTYDDKHLSCDLKHKDGWIEKKLAYKSWIRY